ncbi:MAG: DNA-directed RNA polymerase subunit alpha [Parcubacteria group bacterium GW2011_GWB1_43_8]|nr:MAG: DNA-directed RNA polymerase subunit alpha [Parcubacteria group bacterium GW2011_GWB1_43_8]
MDYKIGLPSKPKKVFEEGNSGVYEISGLYAGYGHTLGNSLRRIILSSIPGAGITSVKIEGVPHEFSKISGIKEDVITILLNLKKVRFKMNTDESQTAKISASGMANVTADDIEVPSQLEVMNKKEHIATLTSKEAKLNIEFTVEKGLGYVSREELKKDKVGIGTIVLDAVFTPIKKVNYEVENMRVGDRTDYNRLRISVETDGSITPAEAVEKSIETMIHHLKAIIGFQEKEEVKTEKAPVGKKEKDEEAEESVSGKEAEGGDKEVLKTRVQDLELSARTLNVLETAGIRTLGGLAKKKESDLMEIEGAGKKVVQEIKRALGNYGLILK